MLDLANRLIGDGIPVIIDKYDLQEGQDLHKFMERMVNDETVTHVLVVTDRAYADKADKREKGVGKEAILISAEVFENADQTKFLPIVFEAVDGEPCRPVFLKGRIQRARVPARKSGRAGPRAVVRGRSNHHKADS